MTLDIAAKVLDSITDPVTPGKIVDALVPAWADIAVVCIPQDHALPIAAYAHINPGQMAALERLQRLHRPAIDDAASIVSRVFRRGIPELLPPMEALLARQQVVNEEVRAILAALGPRTTLAVPLLSQTESAPPIGVLLTSMSASARQVDERDLETLAMFGRRIGPRLRL